jgi:hypothetical protein
MEVIWILGLRIENYDMLKGEYCMLIGVFLEPINAWLACRFRLSVDFWSSWISKVSNSHMIFVVESIVRM